MLATPTSTPDTLDTCARAAHDAGWLSAHDEIGLARRWRDAADRTARDRLVKSHLKLVMRIAHRYRCQGCSVADLVQEGSLGLLHAIDKFEPERGVRLSTYAGWWIRAFMLRYVERNVGVIRGATTSNKQRLFYHLQRTKSQLAAEGKEVSISAIAERLGVTERDVTDMEVLRRQIASLDAPREGEDGRTSPIEQIGDTRNDPAAQFEAAEFSERFGAALERFEQTLEGRRLEAFRERVASDQPVSLQELGGRWGATREVARKVEERVRTPLRRFLYRELGDSVAAALSGP